MYWNRKHVLICTANHCMQKGANNVAGRLRIELKRRGLDSGLMVNTCDSIDLCDIGPNIVVYPERVIYSHVQVSDINDIIAHLQGGPLVERLVLDASTPEEALRRAVFAVTVESESMRAADFAVLAQQHALDEQWINEQARRGFIARKDVDGIQLVTVTSKARARYGLEAVGGGV